MGILEAIDRKRKRDMEVNKTYDEVISSTVSEETLLRIKKIAEKEQCSVEDVMRHALGLELWFSKVKNSNGKVCVVKEDQWYEVELPYV